MKKSAFEPFQLGKFEIPNRLVYAPMTTYSSNPDGTVPQEEIDYYEFRSQGWGMMMTAAACVHPSGWAFPGQWRCDSDEMIPSMKGVAAACAAGGGMPVIQIHHGGRMCPSKLCGEVVAPSAIKYPQSERVEMPREMTRAEIEDVIESFGTATTRAIEAGFKGVEIHGANTYLLQQFVSPSSNVRTDEYGQDRYLFSQRVTERVLESAKGQIAVGYRFSPEEPWDNGIDLAITAELIERLNPHELDWLHISLSNYNQPSIRTNEGPSVLSQIRKLIPESTAFIGVGGIQSAEDVQGCLDEGADLVAVGKAGITSLNFPEAVQNGAEIRTKFPKDSTPESLRIPQGLFNRIKGAAGWFDWDED